MKFCAEDKSSRERFEDWANLRGFMLVTDAKHTHCYLAHDTQVAWLVWRDLDAIISGLRRELAAQTDESKTFDSINDLIEALTADVDACPPALTEQRV